jgi:peptide/nickel transport system ATP-binding protein
VAAPERAEAAGTAATLLRVEHLVRYFPLTTGVLFKRSVGAVKAVDDVSFDLGRGETLGVVGESGCGKSTLARLLMRMDHPTSGRVFLEGRDLYGLSRAELGAARREFQMVMQDPYTSLDPRMTVGEIIGEPLAIHPDVVAKRDRPARVAELLARVGLDPDHANRYPHQFSGGQRQRIGIARALALGPRLIVCDEPVSALDVSIQAQVINLLEHLQQELGVSYVFIAHDLSVVRHMSDRIAVMYLGKFVETGTVDEIYNRATHPYTQALLSAAPVPDPESRTSRRIIRLEGDVPSPANPPSGCRFRTRCWKAQEICAREEPALVARDADPHPSACHFAAIAP